MIDDEILEREVERPASEYAERRGWFEVKIEKTSKRGFPDRFYARGGRIILVEYKRPTKDATTQQKKRHRELRAAGVEVHVIDNLRDAYELLQ